MRRQSTLRSKDIKKPKEYCQQCQAISETTGLRCHNLAQCRVSLAAGGSTNLCNVHAATLRRRGAASVRLVGTEPVGDETGSRFAAAHKTVLMDSASLERLDRIAAEQSEQKKTLSYIEMALRSLEQQSKEQTQTAVSQEPVIDVQQQQPLGAMRLGRFADELIVTARVLHAEIETMQSIVRSLCASVPKKETDAAINPMIVMRATLDTLIEKVARITLESGGGGGKDAEALDELIAEARLFGDRLQNTKNQSRQRLERLCKSKKSTAWPLLSFSLQLASGDIKCNEEPIPLALRNWYLSGDLSGDSDWQNRRLLCNLDAQGSGSDAGNQLEAFRKDQELRRDYSVYDVRDQVVAFGQRREREGKQGPDDAGPGATTSNDSAQRISSAESMLQTRLAWMSTLILLIAMQAAAGRDTSALAYEKVALNVAIGNLALTVGRNVALKYMDEQQYREVTRLAELTGTYAEYLEQADGVIGLATLAAYAAAERLKDSTLDAASRKRATRMAFARAVVALTLLGTAGLAASLRWHSTATAPRTPYKNAPPGAATVPVFETGAQSKKLLELGNATGARFPLPADDGQREFARLLDQMRSPEEQARSVSRQMSAYARAAIVAGVGDAPDALMTIFYPELLTPGGRLFPMTRQQYRRAQLESALTLISPASSEMSVLFQQTLQTMSTVRPGLAKRLRRQQEKSRQRQMQQQTLGQRAAAAGAPSDQQPLALPTGREAAPPILGLPSGGERLPFATAPEQPSIARIDTNQTALDAGASLVGLLPLLAQAASGPAPARVVFPPDVEFARANAERAERRSLESGASPLENPFIFRSAETVADATRDGMTAIRTYQLSAQTPGVNERRDRPDESLALLSAIGPARRSVNETALFFDDVVPPDLDEALDHIAQNRIFAAAQSPLAFIKSVSGTLPGGMSGKDLALLQQRLALMELGISNTTAIDLHLQEAAERFDVIGNPAAAMALDVELLVQMTGRVGYTSAATAAEMTSVAARELAATLGTGASSAAQLANKALQSPALRSLIDAPAALHGFLVGIVEKDMERLLRELDEASVLEQAILDTLHTVEKMSIAGASVVSRQISAALAAIEAQELANVDTSDEFDRLLAQQINNSLQVGAAHSLELARAASASLKKAAGSAKQLSTRAGKEFGAYLTTTRKLVRENGAVIGQFLRSTSEATAEQLSLMTADFVAQSREWSRRVMIDAERFAAKQMELERASAQLVREQTALLESKLQSAVEAYVQKVDTVLREFAEQRESTKRAAMRQKTAVERQLDRLAKQLSSEARKAVEEINRQLAVQQENVLRLQRESLFANIVAQAKRERAEREFRLRMREERQRFVKEALTKPGESALKVQRLGGASRKVAQRSAEMSAVNADLDQAMKDATIEDSMQRRSAEIATVYQESKSAVDATGDGAGVEELAIEVAQKDTVWERIKKAARMNACVLGYSDDNYFVQIFSVGVLKLTKKKISRADIDACAKHLGLEDFVDFYVRLDEVADKLKGDQKKSPQPAATAGSSVDLDAATEPYITDTTSEGSSTEYVETPAAETQYEYVSQQSV